jgi:hypothetical protein
MLKNIILFFITFVFVGCFEPTGKVVVSTDIDNPTIYVDGEKENIQKDKPLTLTVGQHTIKVVKPIDKWWSYEGIKKVDIQEKKTIKVNINTSKVASAKRKAYEEKIAAFDLDKYKFSSPYPNISQEQLQKIKKRVNKLLKEKKFSHINPKDIIMLNGDYDKHFIDEYQKSDLIKTLKGHTDSVDSLAISGDKIVSGSDDNTIKIWDLNTGKLLKTLYGHSNSVNSVAVSGDKIVSGNSDHTIKIWKLHSTKFYQTEKSAKQLYKQIKFFTYSLKDLNLEHALVYKNGKIGEIYVPSVSYTSSTPQTSTTSINGHTYTRTDWNYQSHTDSGYTETRYGYKAINKLQNNSDYYYLVKVKSTWKGKYTNVTTSSSWGGDEHRNWNSTYQNGSRITTLILPPHKYVKYQFEVGEEKAPVTTKIIFAAIVPKEYAEKLFEALDEKNEAVALIDAFLKDSRVSAWHKRLLDVKQSIIDKQNKEFNHRYKDDVKVSLHLPKDYDKDFGGDVTISIDVPTAMCVYINTDFGTKKVFVENHIDKVYSKVQDLSKNTGVSVQKVMMNCD